MGKYKGKKNKQGASDASGPNVYPGAKGQSGVQRAHALISDMGHGRTSLTGRRGARAGRGDDQAVVQGRSDITRAALADKKKKAMAIPADATIVGSGGKKLGA